MKRFVAVAIGSITLSLAAWAGPAAGQTDESTTVAPTTESPTTEAPTTAAPTTEAPTTEAPTTTAPEVTIPPIELPGEQITAGSLTIGTTYHTETDAGCTMRGSLAGQEMNLVKDEVGNVGAVYGRAALDGGEVGLVMVELGPLPMAIAAYRATGACNQDVVGIGAYDATPTSAVLSSVGYSIFPDDYLDNVTIDVQVGASAAPATLDLQSAYDFLIAPR